MAHGLGSVRGVDSAPVQCVSGDLLWEPIWEPIAVDGCGRLWTPVETRASVSGLCGRLWTAVDTAWRSTDQKVGGLSPSGRANILGFSPKPSS